MGVDEHSAKNGTATRVRTVQAITPGATNPLFDTSIRIPHDIIRAGVLDVAYIEHGDPTGWPVVLSHGFPFDVHAYDKVGPALASEGRLQSFRRALGRVYRPPVQWEPPQTVFMPSNQPRSALPTCKATLLRTVPTHRSKANAGKQSAKLRLHTVVDKSPPKLKQVIEQFASSETAAAW